jgi:hypothetical protein
MEDRLEVRSIMQVIFAIEAEMEEINKIKPRTATAMCKLQDRYITLSNAVKYLREVHAEMGGI